ncbi:hypothetical protein EMCRGX_G015348 [Ephydatia muelleri]
MSSEETGQETAGSDNERVPPATIFKLRPLPWRSDRANSIIASMDRKAQRRSSDRAKEMCRKRNVRQTSSDALVVQDHQNIAYLGQTVGNVRQTSSDALVVQDHQNITYLGQTVGNVRQTSSDALEVQDHQNIAYLGQTVGVGLAYLAYPGHHATGENAVASNIEYNM